MKLFLFLFLLVFLSSCFRVIVLKDPLTSEEHTDLGYIYERQGKLDLAEKEYLKAIRKNRKNWVAYYNLGNVYAKRGQWSKAYEFYMRALSIQRDPDLLNNLAYALSKMGQYCKALTYVEEALQKAEKPQYLSTLKSIKEKIEEEKVECLPFEGEGEAR